MDLEELTGPILSTFYEVYNELGTGFLESVYKRAMIIALTQRGLFCQQEVAISVSFRGEILGEFLADIVVERKVILELKAARALDTAHEAQLLNYLRATDKEVGLLINFGPKPSFKRFVFANERKLGPRADPR